MAFVRISIMRPRPEMREHVRSHYQALIDATSKLPGFVRGYVLESSDLSGEVGRVTIWRSQVEANRAANDPRVLSIHSELMLDDRGTMQDWDLNATYTIDAPAAV
ncbi:MAG: antibiotic biosynthesis monooxygenase [Dehalococcoidia bacterium]